MTRDNGPRVEVIPDVQHICHTDDQCEDVAGFRAVCSCDWAGTFHAADDDHDTHDRAHADATTEADEHAARHGR